MTGINVKKKVMRDTMSQLYRAGHLDFYEASFSSSSISLKFRTSAGMVYVIRIAVQRTIPNDIIAEAISSDQAGWINDHWR